VTDSSSSSRCALSTEDREYLVALAGVSSLALARAGRGVFRGEALN
jgi:hypothetical protein